MNALVCARIKLFLAFLGTILFRLRNGGLSLTDMQAQEARGKQAGDFVQPIFGRKRSRRRRMMV